MVDKGKRKKLRIADFGTSIKLESESQMLDICKGTPNYMAPEVESCYNPNKDINFSLFPYKALPTDG